MATEGRSRRKRAGDRQVRIHRGDVGDRRLFEVEHGRVLARVRDLEDSASSSRNAWSRSLPSADAMPWTANTSAAICAASSAVNCGGAESRTELTAERSYSAARLRAGRGDRELRALRPLSGSRSLVLANRLPLSRDERSVASAYVPATDWRLRRHVLRHQGGRDKEVGVRATLTKRDASRFKPWKVGLLAFVLALAVGGMHPGASWGASAYDPSSDPYSMQNIEAGDGAQAWWSSGDTGQGVDVAVIDTGVRSGAGAERRQQDRDRPRPFAPVARPVAVRARHERPRHGHGGDHRRQRRAGRRLSRRGPRFADPLGQGRRRRRIRRREPGDRGDRLGRPAPLRQRDEHPGHQPLVRHVARRSRTRSIRSPTRPSRPGRRASSSSRQPGTRVPARASPIRPTTRG